MSSLQVAVESRAVDIGTIIRPAIPCPVHSVHYRRVGFSSLSHLARTLDRF